MTTLLCSPSSPSPPPPQTPLKPFKLVHWLSVLLGREALQLPPAQSAEKFKFEDNYIVGRSCGHYRYFRRQQQYKTVTVGEVILSKGIYDIVEVVMVVVEVVVVVVVVVVVLGPEAGQGPSPAGGSRKPPLL